MRFAQCHVAESSRLRPQERPVELYHEERLRRKCAIRGKKGLTRRNKVVVVPVVISEVTRFLPDGPRHIRAIRRVPARQYFWIRKDQKRNNSLLIDNLGLFYVFLKKIIDMIMNFDL
jgi:hypothetical protein